MPLVVNEQCTKLISGGILMKLHALQAIGKVAKLNINHEQLQIVVTALTT